MEGDRNLVFTEGVSTTPKKEFRIETWPPRKISIGAASGRPDPDAEESAGSWTPVKEDIFQGIRSEDDTDRDIPLTAESCGSSRWLLHIPELPAGWEDGILRIRYHGDIGQAFVQGRMVSDNYCNDDVWEIGLREIAEAAGQEIGELVIRIVPVKENSSIDTSSPMAGRSEIFGQEYAELTDICLRPVTRMEAEF